MKQERAARKELYEVRGRLRDTRAQIESLWSEIVLVPEPLPEFINKALQSRLESQEGVRRVSGMLEDINERVTGTIQFGLPALEGKLKELYSLVARFSGKYGQLESLRLQLLETETTMTLEENIHLGREVATLMPQVRWDLGMEVVALIRQLSVALEPSQRVGLNGGLGEVREEIVGIQQEFIGLQDNIERTRQALQGAQGQLRDGKDLLETVNVEIASLGGELDALNGLREQLGMASEHIARIKDSLQGLPGIGGQLGLAEAQIKILQEELGTLDGVRPLLETMMNEHIKRLPSSPENLQDELKLLQEAEKRFTELVHNVKGKYEAASGKMNELQLNLERLYKIKIKLETVRDYIALQEVKSKELGHGESVGTAPPIGEPPIKPDDSGDGLAAPQ